MPIVIEVAAHFMPMENITAVSAHGSGNVNDTYLVSTREGAPFILQRINTAVFEEPAAIMENLRIISRHLAAKCIADKGEVSCWQSVHLLPTREDADYHLDRRGGFWRALSYIGNSAAFDTIQHEAHAHETGFALGRFQRLLADLDPALLHDTLPGFHITPRYLARYHAAAAGMPAISASPDANYCRAFIATAAPWTAVLEQAKANALIHERIIHGDPKVSNILLDEHTGRAAALIDLDTVKPGLPQYDVGDCLRSACNPAGEEAACPNEVRFDTDICRAILKGYLGEAGAFLSAADLELFFDAARLIAFELGLRFFTDHLAGNVYFKTSRPEHNLHRAVVQFSLAESIMRQEKAIRQIIAELSPHG